eukprot:2426168-Lingulodinium_polyedra.AAC.1
MAAPVSYCGFGKTFSGLFYRAPATPEARGSASLPPMGFLELRQRARSGPRRPQVGLRGLLLPFGRSAP